MQPCGVCGGTGIDPAGYCTRCRAYRGIPRQAVPQQAVPQQAVPQQAVPQQAVPQQGVPAQQGSAATPGVAGSFGVPPQPDPGSSAPPPAYPQSYELLSPGSGSPYPGPVSAEPYPGPTSGGGYPAPPGHPASGAGTGYGPASGPPYPDPSGGVYYPPGTYGTAGAPVRYRPPAAGASGRGRSSFVTPLLALSGVLVLLVVAIVVVAIVKAGAKGGHGSGGTGPTAADLVDGCVVGDWDEVSHDEGAPIDQIGEVRFTGHGAKLHMNADGTGVTDYGDGVTYTGSGTLAGSGQTVTISLKVSGTITFEYRTNNGAMSFSNVQSDGTAVASVDDREVGSQALEGDANPASYTCGGDVMKQTNSVAKVEWHRNG